MKDFIFGFIWAAVCAWIATWLIGYLDAKTGMLQDFFFPAVIEWVRSWGFLSPKSILYLVLFLIFWATGLHKFVGHWLLCLIGITCLVILAGAVIFLGYHFLAWMISLL